MCLENSEVLVSDLQLPRASPPLPSRIRAQRGKGLAPHSQPFILSTVSSHLLASQRASRVLDMALPEEMHLQGAQHRLFAVRGT